jgi:hypothetical protein
MAYLSMLLSDRLPSGTEEKPYCHCSDQYSNLVPPEYTSDVFLVTERRPLNGRRRGACVFLGEQSLSGSDRIYPARVKVAAVFTPQAKNLRDVVTGGHT